MANKSGAGLAPARGLRELMGFDPFRPFEERFSRFFEGFEPFRTSGEENWSLGAWSPACDIYETDNEIVVKADLPEVKKESVYVSIDNNLLTIRGERKFSEETKKENYHRVERSYGEFMRSFIIPSFVDANKVNAEFKDGVLRVTLAKREESKPKQIEVKIK
jgi:HSP20 family protein